MRRRWLCVVVVFLIVFAARGAVARINPSASGSMPAKSIAVLPFVDLSEGMKNEEFSDGVTEELIDWLSKIPGVRVLAPTASFYFKNKKRPLPEIATTLGVA
jgi:TolB-like protein